MDKKQLPENATPAESAGLARAKRGLPVTQRSVVRVTREDLLQADKVLIEGLEVFANHGVYPAENELGQKFVVSLTLYCNLHEAGAEDDLDASVDYGAVCHDVDEFLREHTFKLIEAAAQGVAELLLRRYARVLGVRVPSEPACLLPGVVLENRSAETVFDHGTRLAVRSEDGLHGAAADDGMHAVWTGDEVPASEVGAIMVAGARHREHARARVEHRGCTALCARSEDRLQAWPVVFLSEHR